MYSDKSYFAMNLPKNTNPESFTPSTISADPAERLRTCIKQLRHATNAETQAIAFGGALGAYADLNPGDALKTKNETLIIRLEEYGKLVLSSELGFSGEGTLQPQFIRYYTQSASYDYRLLDRATRALPGAYSRLHYSVNPITPTSTRLTEFIVHPKQKLNHRQIIFALRVASVLAGFVGSYNKPVPY